uniref:Uncharacterized protein n=1 Tax=Arundo donax TaxID=35708 RepID=A0A0A9DG23_ARUDO
MDRWIHQVDGRGKCYGAFALLGQLAYSYVPFALFAFSAKPQFSSMLHATSIIRFFACSITCWLLAVPHLQRIFRGGLGLLHGGEAIHDNSALSYWTECRGRAAVCHIAIRVE